MKKFLNNRPWKGWKTRKITLLFSVACFLILFVINIITTFTGKEMDSSIISEFIGYLEWIVTTGCVVTIAKVFKGDNDE